MRLFSGAAIVATLVSLVPESLAADSVVYQDSDTGFRFSAFSAQYKLGQTMQFRVATPTGVSQGQIYPVVLQVVSPNNVGWAGLSWGGKMTNSPLTVAWQNGQSVTVSSRYTQQHTYPQPYTGASYEILRTGTKVNGTHWQFTAICNGCTQWGSTSLNPNGQVKFAFAYSGTKPSNPSSNTTSFGVHESYNYWTHDFASAGNSNFDELVARNGGKVAPKSFVA